MNMDISTLATVWCLTAEPLQVCVRMDALALLMQLGSHKQVASRSRQQVTQQGTLPLKAPY